MNASEKIINRASSIADYLRCFIDKVIPLSELKNALNKKLQDSVAEESYRQAAYYLKTHMSPRGFEVHVTKQGVMLERIKLPSFLKRTEEFPELKYGLGCVLWKWLLNVGTDPAFTCKASHQETVATKVARLRDKPVITMIADAGSSTTAAIRALLDVESIPIRPASNNEQEGHCRFITPVIITNALSIASLVSESKHADTIALRLIGGTFHPDLSSICGSMTHQCLQSWGGGGSWKSDLALIGTTGCWPHPSGTLGFACDDFEEARLKGALLDMAFFRIIIMHSSKLTAAKAGNLFAPLSPSLIDLVVVDDGNWTGNTAQVAELRCQAANAGVAVVTLQTERPKAPAANQC